MIMMTKTKKMIGVSTSAKMDVDSTESMNQHVIINNLVAESSNSIASNIPC